MKKCTRDDPHFAPMLKWCVSALDKLLKGNTTTPALEVLPGEYKLGRKRIVIELPELALVTRAEGNQRDGTHVGEAVPRTVTANEVAREMFYRRIRKEKAPSKAKLAEWRADAIRKSLTWEGDLADLLEPEWEAAVATVQAEQPKEPPPPERTRTTCTGTAEVRTTYEPVAKKAAA